jgi:signal transduction histidine kinase
VARARLRNLTISLGILLLLGASIVMLAISERRAHRLAKQQMEFVAGVTHELNTPLAGIRSAAQNLADGVVGGSDAVRRYGAAIEKEGRRLSETLDHVLEFAGIQSGHRTYRQRPLDVSELVGGAIEDSRWLIDERGVELEVQLASGLPVVSADRAALRRALDNLIGNAIKYGNGWVRVSTAASQGAAGRSVEIRVEDRGPGVGAEDRRRIFEPFYRGRLAAGSQTPGSGLGLSVVKEIVEAHGGSVRVETRSEGGSQFTIQLPAAPADGAASPVSRD